MFPKRRGFTSKSSHVFNRVFHYKLKKPSILGYYYSWKHPDFVSRLSWFCFASTKINTNQKLLTKRHTQLELGMEGQNNTGEWKPSTIVVGSFGRSSANCRLRRVQGQREAIQTPSSCATQLQLFYHKTCNVEFSADVSLKVSDFFMNYLGDPGSFFGAPPK